MHLLLDNPTDNSDIMYHNIFSLWIVSTVSCSSPTYKLAYKLNYTWLVVWNIFYVSNIYGISSSQLTNSIIFQRRGEKPSTSIQLLTIINHHHILTIIEHHQPS